MFLILNFVPFLKGNGNFEHELIFNQKELQHLPVDSVQSEFNSSMLLHILFLD